ncbi:twin-arginine translocation pathway signal protein [Falsiroseomonas bella]|uniref:Twin-arginine translocation pathway signal protein n=1 Tax=Falsiroseomonas bella TaxID=2184016 RepID=A0A317FHL8_9PROT|nr:ABC transporter substrate-binding protein [Falsiroseomonas bella]PWS37429.1 twin-arginine translocation pathway signal protein [Falsiroseomonas bella]
MRRRDLIQGTAIAAALAAGGLGARGAAAQQAGDPIRKLVILSRPQSNNPQAYQAAEIIAQEWRKLGLDVEIRPLPRQQQSEVVWNRRQEWDMTMWQMVGRPERSDPDELVFNLFHSSTAPTGFNFVGWADPEYDRLAEAQRVETNPDRRREIIRAAQERVNQGQPYLFLVHPKQVHAFNKAQLREGTLVNQAGLGLRNIWTYLGVEPVGNRRDMVLNASEPVQAIHPLWISGATDSWVTELVWDRIMRIGPDGLPRPWAAETVTQVDPTTIDITIRQGMKFHDGSPVTVDDCIFSFEAPAIGNEVPMYRPFVLNIAKVEKTGDRSFRITLKQADAGFFTSSLAKLNIIQKSAWEPVLRDYQNRPENIERFVVERPIGSGPFKVSRARLSEEIVLERNADHWAAPKIERWILRIVQNVEATLGMLNRGEINFLADYTGDPDLVKQLVSRNRNIVMNEAVDVGFQFLGWNMRRPPFNDPAFRRALSAAVNRELMAEAAWNGFAEPANSHVSPALPFWHREGIVGMLPSGLDQAQRILQEAGYRVVNGRLHYPAGTREQTTPN